MTTLQEFLNNKYPNPEEVKKISATEITEQLEGGELDLSAFTNLEKLEIDPSLLTTPLTKLTGFVKLKEIDWLETKPETEAEKKLFEELGISSDLEKKRVVQEVQKLAELKGIKVDFKEKTKGSIYLNLEQKDKEENFSPSLVFWTFSQELALMEMGEDKTSKNPSFWTNFEEQKIWVKENLNEEYQKEFEKLLNPSTFPLDQLEIKDFLTVHYPNLDPIIDQQENKALVEKEIVDQAWEIIKKELLELTNQELKNNPGEGKINEMSFKILIECSASASLMPHYTLLINYHANSPLKEKIRELFIKTPLQLKNELLEEKNKQSPPPESLEKLKQQVQILERFLQDSLSEEEYHKVKDEISKIE